MRRSRFSIEQIAAAPKQVELWRPISDLIRKVGISEQTFFSWTKPCPELEQNWLRKITQLQQEHSRLKKLVSDLSRDNAIFQDIAAIKWGGPR